MNESDKYLRLMTKWQKTREELDAIEDAIHDEVRKIYRTKDELKHGEIYFVAWAKMIFRIG